MMSSCAPGNASSLERDRETAASIGLHCRRDTGQTMIVRQRYTPVGTEALATQGDRLTRYERRFTQQLQMRVNRWMASLLNRAG